jgi:NADH:quinone reductase (non-electrogenic)
MSENSSVTARSVPHVIIVGGGFAGVAAAKALQDAPVRITLIDRTNYHLFQPLLFQVAAGILEPGTIATPIRSLFRGQKNVAVRMAVVSGVDKTTRRVLLADGRQPLHYDYLVLATGVTGSYFGHDEWAQVVSSMKSLADAEAIRRRIVDILEQAEQEDDPAVREELLTFVVVGAGPTGCELAGGLVERFHRTSASEFRRIDPKRANIVLVEAGPRVLPGFSESLAAGATDALRKLGVDIRTGHAVEQVDAHGVVIAGERLPAQTVLWAAGVTGSPAATWLATESDRAGRAIVLPDLSISGYPEIFVVGDTAHIDHNGTPLPGVAQVALQSGKHAGETIRARVLNRPPPPRFTYFDKGNMATIASTYAIIEHGRFKLSGMFGKLGWAFVHVLYLGRLEGQLLLALQWVFGLAFGRTSSRNIDPPNSELKPGPATPPRVVPKPVVSDPN